MRTPEDAYDQVLYQAVEVWKKAQVVYQYPSWTTGGQSLR